MEPPSWGPSNEQLAAPGEGSDIVVGESKSRPLPLKDSVGDSICCWCICEGSGSLLMED